MGLHPSFDELSAHADRADTDAARSRVGRHVARCTACRATVAEIHAMGDAARSSEVARATAGLWARIEHLLDDGVQASRERHVIGERVMAVTASRDAEPAPGTSGEKRIVSNAVRRTSLGLMLLVAATAAVIAIDAREPLAAAKSRRLTSDREFARPGTGITFHYRPIDALASESSLTVWTSIPGKGATKFDQPLQRAGTLRRVSALDFTGTVLMPDSTPLAMFVVGDSTGENIDRSEGRAGRLPIVVLAADSRGQPRFDAFVIALGSGRGSTDSATMARWARKMRELYPSAPETWILGDAYAHRSVIGDIVKIFESRERKYYGWHDRLEKRTGLSEETETMMASLGWELMDTARAEFWATRLLRDHPTSPWAPMLWIQRYRDVPNDSAAIVLREFESIYSSAKPSRTALANNVLSRAISLADRSGDSTLIRRWHSRADPGDYSWLMSTELTRMAGDRAALADVRRRLLVALAEADSAIRSGPTLWGRTRFFAMYQRQSVLTRLAAVQLIGGDPRGAKVVLDSLVAAWAARPTCPMPETLRWRAEASRQLGLMADARADLAYVVVTGDWRRQVLSDSVPALLGPAYTKASWDSALAEANRLKQKCWADSRDARRHGGG
jgi:hypothetical protein